MLSFLRGPYGRLLQPLARLLLRTGLGPTTVTVLGTVGVVVAALAFLPRGQFLVGGAAVAVCLLADGLDGTMARLSGRESRFGAFMDSTMDRLADAAVFAALAWWGAGHDAVVLGAALACLTLGMLVSYARARAEAEGWDASVGIFERTDRLVVALLGVLGVGLGAPTVVLAVALVVVAVGSAVTVAQRVAAAHAQTTTAPGAGAVQRPAAT